MCNDIWNIFLTYNLFDNRECKNFNNVGLNNRRTSKSWNGDLVNFIWKP